MWFFIYIFIILFLYKFNIKYSLYTYIYLYKNCSHSSKTRFPSIHLAFSSLPSVVIKVPSPCLFFKQNYLIAKQHKENYYFPSFQYPLYILPSEKEKSP